MSGHHEFMKFHVKLCRWEIRTQKKNHSLFFLPSNLPQCHGGGAESFLMTCATKRAKKNEKNLSEIF
jgi:hypothetical protein